MTKLDLSEDISCVLMAFLLLTYCIEASPEELMKLLEGNRNRFTKCSFRVNTSVRQRGYCGRLPTPDSPDIKIPGRVRGVYEDDVVVLEIQPDTRAHDEEGQRKETAVFGYIRGENNKKIYNLPHRNRRKQK